MNAQILQNNLINQYFKYFLFKTYRNFNILILGFLFQNNLRSLMSYRTPRILKILLRYFRILRLLIIKMAPINFCLCRKSNAYEVYNITLVHKNVLKVFKIMEDKNYNSET